VMWSIRRLRKRRRMRYLNVSTFQRGAATH
jgi:hypothetical protein